MNLFKHVDIHISLYFHRIEKIRHRKDEQDKFVHRRHNTGRQR